MSLVVRIVAFTVVVVAGVSPAFAEPIRITSGAFAMPGTGPAPASISLSGEGFTFNAMTGPTDALITPWLQCGLPECMAGTTVDLFTNVGGLGLRSATATFEGKEYVRVGGLGPLDAAMMVEWDGSVVIPDGFTGGTLTAPFTFAGVFSFLEGPEFNTRRLELSGAGTASVTFRPYADGAIFPGAYVVSGLRFDFADVAATPEPASLLLLGTGLAGLAAARRRRRA